MAILKVTTDATTLEALLTGKARLASWCNWPQTEVLELRDPFQDAVPCWQQREPYLMTDQWRYEISRGLTKLSYSQWIQEVKDSRE